MAEWERARMQLAIGVGFAFAGAGLILIAAPHFREMFNAFGAELPLLSRLLIMNSPIALIMPVVVIAIALGWPRREQRPMAALIAGLAMFLISPVLLFFAAYWPIFRLAATQ